MPHTIRLAPSIFFFLIIAHLQAEDEIPLVPAFDPDMVEAPAEPEKQPAEAETPPAEGETPPAEGETPPAEGEKPPAEGEKPPAEGEKPPAEGAKPPAEGAKPPAEGAKPPAEGAKPPAEGAKPPAEGAKPAAEGAKSPAEEGPNPLDAVNPPKAVYEKVAEIFPSGKVTKARKEQKGSLRHFVIGVADANGEHELELSSGGNVVAQRDPVKVDDLPRSAQDTLGNRYQHSEYVSGVKTTNRGKTSYEVEIKDAQGNPVKLQFDEDGKAIK